MIDVNAFLVGARRFASGELRGTMNGFAQHGSLSESLARLTGELDDLMVAGGNVSEQLTARKEFIRRTANALDDPAQRSFLASTPDELRLLDADGVDDLDAVVGALKTGGARFDAATDDALQGVKLLDKENPDDVVSYLKAASSIWDNDLMGRHSDAIERQLRGEEPINAHAASLLAQPIATARIPVSLPNGKGYEITDVLMYPHEIVSPPQGFSTLDDARVAAINYLEHSPGKTVIQTTEPDQSMHLLAVDRDTSTRTVRAAKKVFGGVSEKQKRVDFEANHPSISMVYRTDNTEVNFMNSAAPSGSWPEGQHWPVSVDDLRKAGLASPHSSLRTRLQHAEQAADEQAQIVGGAREELLEQRRVLRDQRQIAMEFEEVLSSPGEGTPIEWEVQPALHLEVPFGVKEPFEYSDVLGGFTKPLPGKSLSEAVRYLTGIDAGESSVSFALMSDASGTPHIVAMPETQQFQLPLVHKDVRAIYAPGSGAVQLRKQSGEWSKVLVRSASDLSNDGFEKFARKWIADNVQNIRYGGSESAKLVPITGYSTMIRLKARSVGRAAEEAAEISKEDRGVLVVDLSVELGIPNQFGLIKRSNTSLWNRQYDFAKEFPGVVAALERGEVVFVRT